MPALNRVRWGATRTSAAIGLATAARADGGERHRGARWVAGGTAGLRRASDWVVPPPSGEWRCGGRATVAAMATVATILACGHVGAPWCCLRLFLWGAVAPVRGTRGALLVRLREAVMAGVCCGCALTLPRNARAGRSLGSSRAGDHGGLFSSETCNSTAPAWRLRGTKLARAPRGRPREQSQTAHSATCHGRRIHSQTLPPANSHRAKTLLNMYGGSKRTPHSNSCK